MSPVFLSRGSKMPDQSSNQQQPQSKTNPKLKSSIVHKPFATGTINIFNPYKNRSNRSKANNTNHNGNSKLSPPKVFLNAELETIADSHDLDLDFAPAPWAAPEIVYCEANWWDSLFSPWGISAIALLFLVNLIAAGFIWRNARHNSHPTATSSAVTTVGNSNLTNLDAQEFMPLTLGTLGSISTVEAEVEQSHPKLDPISPALAPLNDIASLSSFNTQYHYVLTEYTGEQSLIRAKQKTPQVSLVNFPQGVFIYLGAFKNREDAEQFVAQLQQDNFSAYVYPLD